MQVDVDLRFCERAFSSRLDWCSDLSQTAVRDHDEGNRPRHVAWCRLLRSESEHLPHSPPTPATNHNGGPVTLMVLVPNGVAYLRWTWARRGQRPRDGQGRDAGPRCDRCATSRLRHVPDERERSQRERSPADLTERPAATDPTWRNTRTVARLTGQPRTVIARGHAPTSTNRPARSGAWHRFGGLWVESR